MSKVVEKEKAMKLRKEGYSYSYIQECVNVSKSTLSYWLANIPYEPNRETRARIGNAKSKTAIAKNRQKIDSIARAREEASKDIKTLSHRDLFMIGLGLYIGEGTKTNNTVRIINADPRVVRIALKWFREVIGLNTENFAVRIHIYPDNNKEECLAYWSQETQLPLSQFQKTQVDKRVDKKMGKRSKLPYGTAHITIRSCGKKEFGVFLARKIEAWMEEIYEKV